MLHSCWCIVLIVWVWFEFKFLFEIQTLFEIEIEIELKLEKENQPRKPKTPAQPNNPNPPQSALSFSRMGPARWPSQFSRTACAAQLLARDPVFPPWPNPAPARRSVTARSTAPPLHHGLLRAAARVALSLTAPRARLPASSPPRRTRANGQPQRPPEIPATFPAGAHAEIPGHPFLNAPWPSPAPHPPTRRHP